MSPSSPLEAAPPPTYVDVAWLAARWGVCPRTARSRTRDAGFPSPFYPSRRPRWDRDEVVAFERREKSRARRVVTASRPQYRLPAASGHTTVIHVFKEAS